MAVPGLAVRGAGVGGEFAFRATILGDRIADGFLEIVGVYCPENSQKAEAFVDSLQLEPRGAN